MNKKLQLAINNNDKDEQLNARSNIKISNIVNRYVSLSTIKTIFQEIKHFLVFAFMNKIIDVSDDKINEYTNYCYIYSLNHNVLMPVNILKTNNTLTFIVNMTTIINYYDLKKAEMQSRKRLITRIFYDGTKMTITTPQKERNIIIKDNTTNTYKLLLPSDVQVLVERFKKYLRIFRKQLNVYNQTSKGSPIKHNFLLNNETEQ